LAQRDRTTVVTAFLLLASALSAPAQIPLGSEFRVDRSGSVQAPFPGAFFNPRSAAIAKDGTFILTWVRDTGAWPGSWDIMGRIVDANGQPRPPELLINTYTTNVQENDAVAMDDAGNFVVVWTSNTGALPEVRGRAGYGGTEFLVGTSPKWHPAVAAAPDGKFVVIWAADDGDGGGIFAQRFEADGAPIGGEFQVNTYTTGRQMTPSVDVDAAGNFVVAWASQPQVPSGNFSVVGQRFTAAGVRQGAEFAVSAAATDDQYSPIPRVSRAASGPFVVVWEERVGNREIAARRFDAAGAPVGAEFRANTFTTGIQHQPDVDMDLDGDFVIAWTGQGQDGSGDGVFARRFSATGGAGAEFRVNTYTTNRQWTPRIAVDRAGNFVVGWHSYKNGESTLQAQRYAGGLSAAALTVDGSAGPTSDGNGVFEAGETVTVAPAWLNANSAAQTFTGTASSFTGPGAPGNPTYTISDGAASYGTVASGATASCTAATDCYALGVTVPSTRPVQHWDASFREEISPSNLGAAKNWTLHVGESFADVPRASGFYRFVETLLHRGITGGCNAAEYCPSSSTTRQQMAVFVLVAKEGAGYTAPACTTPMFNDVPASSPFCPWIEELARRGVVGGCGGGNYCPSAPVNRQQMAVFVLLTKEPGVTPPACGTPRFNDVPASSPFCRWIEELARRGVVTGCGGGNYCPTAAVTREQMAVFITVTFGLMLYGP
jgi:hypothetical protein